LDGESSPDRETEECRFEIDDGDMPQIPEGEYIARIVEWETKKIFKKKRRLYLLFEICELGSPYLGKQLRAYYGIANFIGKPRKSGNFRLGRKHRFLKEYQRVLGHAHVDKYGLSMEALAEVLIKVRVENVTKDANKEDRSGITVYSKVAEMLCRAPP
jgi:hypothetical protein